VTSYFMFKGVRAVSSGQSMELSKALQGRVAGQFFTLAVVMGTAVYIGMHSKDNIARATETDILMKKQGTSPYHTLYHSALSYSRDNSGSIELKMVSVVFKANILID